MSVEGGNTMTQPSGSQWQVQRRCLAIIRRVQQGNATWESLAKAVTEQEGDEAYNQLEDEPLREAVSRDVKRIRDLLKINISYRRSEGIYEIQPDEENIALLDLPDSDLATMAWLEQIFPPNTPKHHDVSDFLKRLRLFLGPSRLTELARQQLGLDLSQRDKNSLNPELLGRLQRAIDRRQQVEIEYDALRCEVGFLERHRLNIYEAPYFESGHYYVRGWGHYLTYKGERETVRNYRYFRLERIQALEVLPLTFPSEPKPFKQYPVSYQITADLARHGISYQRWIAIKHTETSPDGSIIVHGRTISLFWAKQSLLRYGRKCTVLGGAELLAEMRKEVNGLAEIYLVSDEADASHN